jgi:hypothetical protein
MNSKHDGNESPLSGAPSGKSRPSKTVFSNRPSLSGITLSDSQQFFPTLR